MLIIIQAFALLRGSRVAIKVVTSTLHAVSIKQETYNLETYIRVRNFLNLPKQGSKSNHTQAGLAAGLLALWPAPPRCGLPATKRSLSCDHGSKAATLTSITNHHPTVGAIRTYQYHFEDCQHHFDVYFRYMIYHGYMSNM